VLGLGGADASSCRSLAEEGADLEEGASLEEGGLGVDLMGIGFTAGGLLAGFTAVVVVVVVARGVTLAGGAVDGLEGMIFARAGVVLLIVFEGADVGFVEVGAEGGRGLIVPTSLWPFPPCPFSFSASLEASAGFLARALAADFLAVEVLGTALLTTGGVGLGILVGVLLLGGDLGVLFFGGDGILEGECVEELF